MFCTSITSTRIGYMNDFTLKMNIHDYIGDIYQCVRIRQKIWKITLSGIVKYLFNSYSQLTFYLLIFNKSSMSHNINRKLAATGIPHIMI